MAFIKVTNIQFKEPIQKPQDTINLTIAFDCLKDLPKPLVWKIVYIGDALDSTCDQILDTIEMDTVDYGASEFEWDVNAPDYS